MINSIRLLHLEDSPRDAELIAERLKDESRPYSFVLTNDKASFESAVLTQPADVILCDYHVPGYGGLAALRFVLKQRPDTPVIILSGTLGDEAAVECLKAGATDYLLKHNLTRLPAAITRAMNEAHERRKRRESERLFSNLFEFSPDALLIADDESRIIQSNHQVETLFGWSRTELAGKLLYSLLPIERRSDVDRSSDDNADGRRAEVRACRKDGTPFPAEVSIKRIQFGDVALLLATVRDVSARHRFEAALRTAERRYRTLFETSPVGVLTIDLQTHKPIEFNDIAARQLGYLRQEFAELAIEDYEAQETPEEINAAIEQVRNEGEATFETQHRTKSGEIRDVLVTVRMTGIANEESANCVFQDITERKHAEAELRVLSRAVEQSPASVVITDRNGNIRYVNEKFTAVSGYSAEEALGRNPRFLKSGEMSDEEYRDLWRTISRGGEWRGEFHNRKKNGELYWELATITPLFDDSGNVTQYLALKEDITKRRELEKSLAESQAMLSAIFDTISDGIVLADEGTGKIVLANAGLSRLLGCDLAEIRNRDVATLLQTDDERFHLAALQRAVLGELISDVRVSRRHGSFIHVDVSAARIVLQGRKHIVVSIRDVTDRKLALDELHRLTVDLERRVTLRTQELAATNESLIRAQKSAEDSSRAKSEFLSAMSHELRTPLNGILGMNELLLTTELNDRQRQYVDASNSSGKVLMQLINDILDLSKIESGKLELDPRECDIEALAADIVAMMTPAVATKGLELRCRLAPEACVVVRCDDHRLRQILINLIGNASKFTASGRISVAVDHVRRSVDTVRLRFSVTDTGMGIPADRLDRLFKPFSQVDSSTTRQFGGTGLGLSICQELVRLMHGEIGVESSPGTGSTFWFEIDVATVEEATPEHDDRKLPDGMRVLGIDVRRQDRSPLLEYLKHWRCALVQVASLQEGLAQARADAAAGTPFQVALLDCRLAADQDGVMLQQLAAVPGMHIIALGCLPDNLAAARLKEAGISQQLLDPVRPRALFKALELACSGAASRGELEHERTTKLPEVRLAGHVLVAEDNRINQLYIIDLLKYFSCTSDLAASGEEVLTAVEKRDYDLILMDCQMPEMDGFAASREIRRRESAGALRGRRPIVALTANALKGDRERCLEAGMDDYLSKPVEAEQMGAVLQKYLSRSGPENVRGA